MARFKRGAPLPKAVELAEWITQFVNVVWGRKLRSSKALVDAVESALENGYTEDHIRSVYWVAASLPGDEFIKDALRPGKAIDPEVLLRFHGRVNNYTGKDAVRWLDILGARVEETSSRLVAGVLERVSPLGAEVVEREREFLERAGFPME